MTDTATTDPISRAVAVAVADALARELPGAIDRMATAGGPRAYSVADVAKRLDVSPQTVYLLIRSGHLPAIPHLPRTRIAAAALDAFMAGRRTGPDAT